MTHPGNNLFFNGTELTAIPGLIIESIRVSDPPRRVVETYKRARAHGRAVAGALEDDRPIIVTGKFARNSQREFEQARDTLLSAIYRLQGVLQTDIAGAPRLFNCTLEQPSIPEHLGGLADVRLDFNAYDPFGYDLNYTTPTLTSNTAAIKDFSVTFGGSAPTQYPIFTITVTTVTGASSASVINLLNLNTGQTLSITGLVSAGDVFVIDTELGKVFKNGVAVSFGGPLPYATPGLTYFRYTDSSITTRSITIQPKYRKRHL